MGFYESLYALDKKDNCTTAQVISGSHEGMHAIFVGGEVLYAEGELLFWKPVMDMSRESENENTLLSVGDDLIYMEKLSEQMRLVICGAGHVSIPVIKIAKMLGFLVTALDDRSEFTENARQAGADEVICGDFRESLKKIKGDKNTYFAIITRGHKCDRACLEEILFKENAYIGMIGSRKRVGKQLSDMKAAGFPADLLEAVHTPIGLMIGAQTPEEIAVSIMAEIIQIKNGRVKTTGYDRKMLTLLAGQNKENPQKEMALAVIVDKSGSGPRETGTKMLVFKDGSIVGTIGGGQLEADVIKEAVRCIKEQHDRYFEYEMSLKEAEEDGMACGGTAKLFIEAVRVESL